MITNSKIKLIKSLSHKKNRIKHNLFIVEGERMVDELLKSKFEIVELYATNDWRGSFKGNVVVNTISQNQLKRISQLVNPNKVLAIVKKKKFFLNKDSRINIVIDDLINPGNLGTIIRLCDWFGVCNIICSENTVDVYNSKVVQSSMGSLFRVSVIYTNILTYLKEIKGPIYAACLEGEDIRSIHINQQTHIVVGSENTGVSDDILKLVNRRITIKGTNQEINSINAAIATGIILYQMNN